MIDPNLERRFAECSELVDAWKVFQELVLKATKPPKTTNAQLEQQFLNAKARIAILHDSFMESLKHDKQIGSNMLEIVNRAITLRTLSKVTDAEAKKMEQEWHEVFMLLNGTVSDLNEDRAKLAEVNELSHNMGKVREKIFVYLKSFLNSIWLKIAVVVGVILFIIWGGPAMGLYSWDGLRRYPALKPVVKPYLNIMRDKVGLKMPYYDIQTVTEPLLAANVAGVSPELRTDKNPRDTIVGNMLYQMRLYGPDQKELEQAKGILNGAGGYDYIRYVADGNSAEGSAAIFWFEKTADAEKFMAIHRTYSSQLPDTYFVIQKVNVVILLYSSKNSFLGDMKNKRINVLKP
jgi:hypothetical protein